MRAARPEATVTAVTEHRPAAERWRAELRHRLIVARRTASPPGRGAEGTRRYVDVGTSIDERRHAADQFAGAGHHDRAGAQRAEADVLARLLDEV